MTPDGGFPRSGPDSLEDSRAYRMLLWCVRVAWASCTIGVIAMLPALVLRSSELVTVFKLCLSITFAATVGAVLVFVPLTARMHRYGMPRASSLGSRADALVAVLLADLLDAE